MRDDEIIRMASEAGCDMSHGLTTPPVLKAVVFTPKQLKRFATLVAAAEREACAKLADEWNTEMSDVMACKIRARGQQ